MKKNTDHVIIRNEKLFCSNCGQSQDVPYPIAIPIFTAMSDAFIKMHTNCAKTWEQPTVEQELSENAKADWWLSNGERGLSSEFIFQVISGRNIGARNYEPSDPDDFRRCYLLLQAVPEWKMKLNRLKPFSKYWSNLVDNWDKLNELLEEQLKTKKANGMYEFMRKLAQ
jgi:hypothetical protein